MDPLEADLLVMYGYIPTNVQACRDYTDKKITSQELWRIIHANINLRQYIDPLTHVKAIPREKDIVRRGDEGDYTYGRIAWIKRQEDCVNVFWFLDENVEQYTLEDFNNYDSTGGKTMWLLPY